MSFAASTRPWPMISPSFPISTGLVKPNRRVLSAICRICFLEWVVEREEWREEAFGMPNLESVAGPGLNPGVDTDGQPVLVGGDDFREWLTSGEDEVNKFWGGATRKATLEVAF